MSWVADTLERALHAATLVGIKYDEQTPVAGLVPHLHDAYMPPFVGGQKDKTDTRENDARSAMEAAPARFEQIYGTPTENHNPMEPHAAIASWDGDRLTMYDSTQGVFGARKRLAELLRISPDQIRVICHYVGGGFGSKGPVWSHSVLAALCAWEVKRPVKIALERPQMFNNTGSRAQTHQTLAFGAADDGKLSALTHTSISHTSSFDEFTESAAGVSRSLYACPNVFTAHRLVKLNLGTPSYMRAPGEAPGNYALESAMDELAYQLKLDPIELRLKNYAETDQDEKKPYSSKSLRQCYEQGAQAFGWQKRRENPTPRSIKYGDLLVGYGMATSTYPTHRSPSHAFARLNADGTALVQSGSQDLGTGTWTVMTQIAAATLGLPLEKVRFELGDTILPETPVSRRLADRRQHRLRPCATPATPCARNSSNLPSPTSNPPSTARPNPTSSRKTAASFSRATHPRASPSPPSSPGRGFLTSRSKATPSPATKKSSSPCTVSARNSPRSTSTPSSGEVRVARWVGAFGVGHLLNAKTARSQLIGGIVFGIGMALMEHTVADDRDARLVNPNLAEYHVPVNADVPDMDIIFVNEDDPHINPLGVKGVGEIGITGAVAAIANAVYHATGTRVRELPITPDTLLGV